MKRECRQIAIVCALLAGLFAVAMVGLLRRRTRRRST
jgi:hypothetical protein